MTRQEEIAWLAGLLEGEGYFSLERDTAGHHNVTIIRIVLSMADEDVVRRAAAIMVGPVVMKRAKSYLPHYKDQFRTKVSGFKAAGIMREILPFMGIRRSARIGELLTAWESRSTWSDGARARCARQREALANAG